MAWKTRKLRSGWGKIRERLDAGGSDMCRWGWRAFSRIRLGRVGLLLLPLRCARTLSNSRLRPSRQERRTGAQIAGQGGRSEPFDCGAHLGGQWFEAASDQDLQAFQGE